MKGYYLHQMKSNIDLPTPSIDNLDPPNAAVKLLCEVMVRHRLLPVGFKEEKKGMIFHNVIPLTAYRDEFSNRGSCELLPHTDGPHRQDSPQWTLLLCIRNEPMAYTLVSFICDIIMKLRPKHVSILSDPERFLHVPSTSWVDDKPSTHSVIYRNSVGDLCVRCNLKFCQGLDKEAVTALAELKRVAYAEATSVYLQPGDVIVIDNQRALHARTTFHSSGDAKARWLVRVYANEVK